jgi:hypothetical protein
MAQRLQQFGTLYRDLHRSIRGEQRTKSPETLPDPDPARLSRITALDFRLSMVLPKIGYPIPGSCSGGRQKWLGAAISARPGGNQPGHFADFSLSFHRLLQNLALPLRWRAGPWQDACGEFAAIRRRASVLKLPFETLDLLGEG